MKNIIRNYTQLMVQGESEQLDIYVMSLSLGESISLANHVYLIQSKMQNV